MPIRRQFIDWHQPLLPAVADLLVQRYAGHGRLDLRNVVMVFTGRRATRRMLEVLYERASPQYPAFIPPRMITFQHFPEMLYQPQNRFADDLTQLLIWKKAISSIPARELKAALPSLPADDAVPAWLALCESLRAQHNELAEEGIEFDEVFSALSSMGNEPEAERWKALRRIQSEYLMQMDRLQLWDRQASRLIAVEKQECAVDFDIILVGTVDMNRVVQQMLAQVADSVTAIIHAPESEADAFDEFGCLRVEKWTDRLLNIDIGQTRIADSPDQQASLAVQELAAFEGTRRPDEITIGIADDSLVPAVLQKLSDAGVSGRWPVGMQLKQSRPWRLLTGVLEHLSSARAGQPPDFATLSGLVRHPDMTDWVDRHVRRKLTSKKAGPIDWLTALDEYIAQHLQTSPGALLGPKGRREIVGAVIAAVEELLGYLCPHDVMDQEPGTSGSSDRFQQLLFSDEDDESEEWSLHRQLESRQRLNVWAQGVLRLLNAVYGNRELQPELFRDRALAECCHELGEAARILSGVPADVMLNCTAAQAIQFLLREVGETPVAPPANEQAIDLLGWLELAMDDSPVLLLTGFNEGFVPESVSSDVFLPNTLRSRLGLRDNHRRYARDAYALTAMLHSREKIVFIAGRHEANGNPLTPSRLWFAADADSLPERVRRFYDPAADPGHSLPATSLTPDFDFSDSIDKHQRHSGFIVPRPTGVPSTPVEIPVSSFREYIYCPYRYFLKRELKLRSVEDETLELEASTFGSLLHHVLNQFGTSHLADSLRPEPIRDFLLKALHAQALRRFGRQRSATVNIQLQMMESRLESFAEWQAATAAQGWRITVTENALTCPDFRDAKGRLVRLSGRVDRIDRNKKTKQWRVLDYKTSEQAQSPESTHRRRNGEWVDLQLPLYRLLVQSLGIPSSVQLGYVHLPGNLAQVGASIAEWSEADLHSAETTAREVAANILDLKIDHITTGSENRAAEFSRICQDTVIDRNIPWLADWPGR
ncbi:MAG: PD-(D/E)XK nuclease family protein [Planctomycetaceae bacterium]